MASDKVEWAYDGDVWHGDIVSTAFGDYVALWGNDKWTEDRRRFVRRGEVKRVYDIPPEPTEPGTVVYDRDDVAWRRNMSGEWSGQTVNDFRFQPWRAVVRGRGPLHPYPRAARAEIERLTAERDEATAEVTAESTRFAEVERLLRVAQENAESRLQSAMAATERADELQRRIDRALEYLGELKPFSGRVVGGILRGEVDQ